MQYLSSTFAATLVALLALTAAEPPAHAAKHAARKKQTQHETASFSAIDETNTEVAPDESNFASAKPEKHRAAAARDEDPINAMATAIKRSPGTQHRNTSVGNSSDLQPFTEFEIPQ